jgi:hypothetical protein
LARAEGPPEVPLEHVPDPQEVLDEKRLVEAELPEHCRTLFAAELPLRPREDVDDVPREEPDKEEDQHGDTQQGEHGPGSPTREVAHLR